MNIGRLGLLKIPRLFHLSQAQRFIMTTNPASVVPEKTDDTRPSTASSGNPEPKSKNQEKNEAKRLAKLAKFEAKQAALKAKAQASGNGDKKKKEKVVQEATPEPEYVNTTPPGEKKDMTAPFATVYKPKAVESAWYEWWEKQGYFKPELKPDGTALDAGTFVIPIPPPNVTGSLHLGHALTNSIQDCLIRWNRMKGKTVLWVPGVDHAGIATQIVVEKKLMKQQKITRHEVGREKFIEKVFEWKDQYGNRIYDQLRKLGSSLDWDRAKFTMDESLSKAVKEAFIRMHEDGTIYRANRLVNWCTKLKTALSNLEVENMELEGRTLLSVPDHDPKKKYEFGVIISFAYLVEGSNERIVVATTRLETMLGDSAIAVHPNDERYKHLHGKFVIHPFQNRRIPIVADDYVDPAFGTGAVKITPAHDFNDFQMGQRHKLEFINIFTDEGQINEHGAPFVGLQRFDARVAVLEGLKEKGLYVETNDNKMVLPICGRSGNIVEPLMKPQWWVSGQKLAPAACDVVRNGELNIIPQQSEKEWFRWLDNIQDWCISRQLWWGHRVPAYFVEIKGQDASRDDEARWVSARDEDEALDKATKKFNVSRDDITLHQDEDVLDTWFSSGLWPFSIMGWPEKTRDYELFFPNTLLETGCDILFFWVARMVMMSLHLTGKVPFQTVFCHAMVRDAHGRKMSKSLGNVIDPLDVIRGITLAELHEKLEQGNLDSSEVEKAKEGQKADFPNGIPECGTDALRFTLLAYTSAGRDLNLDILRVDGYKKFCNKLWNATRFALMKLGDNYKPRPDAKLTGNESLAEKWILCKLNKCIIEANQHIEAMNFMQATSVVHQFWLYELCDVYLEVCKPVIDGDDLKAKESAQNVLYIALDQGLKLLHPFMPFVTEELYQRLARRPNDTIPTIMKTRYPEPVAEWDNQQALDDYEFTNLVIRSCRSLMGEYGIKNNITLYVQSSNPTLTAVLKREAHVSQTLIRGCTSYTVLEPSAEAPQGCALMSANAETNVFLLVKGQVDLDAEIKKLEVKLSKIQELSNNLVKAMGAEGYALHVKDTIKQADEAKLKGYEAEIEALRTSIDNFNKLK